MPATILVVEYEPRYTDRIRQALAGRPFSPQFARDGEEALRALSAGVPDAIAISWILPKTNTAELVKAIRGNPVTARVPILLLVSGYNGHDTRGDARRAGGDDILPKPFSDNDLLSRLASLTGIDAEAVDRMQRELGDFSIASPPASHPAAPHAVASTGEKITSDQLFGEVVDEAKPAAPAPPAAPAQAAPAHGKKESGDDLDELLSQTLIAMRKKKGEPAKATSSGSKPLDQLDRLVEDTLSGLPRTRRKEPAPEEAEPFAATPPEEFDRVHAASPLIAAEPRVDEPETIQEGSRFGEFVLLEKIATGGMAEVWKAQRQGVEGFQKFVAIKRILPHLASDPEFLEMFVDEAKIAARLNHPNIIHIYDLGRTGRSYFIAMELVEGHDLKSILRQASERGFPMGVELALFIASRLGSALDYAHRKEPGLVHRDVSPQNVLISAEGDIKLCDFGIAKATSKVSHTQVGALKGKLQYMSPEQASGKALDRRSDIFALGVVLYEMLTGEKLFGAENEISVLERVREARVTPPSSVNDEIPPELDAVVLRALARDPEGRYATAGDLVKDLDRILYATQPAPTAADLAIYIDHLFSPAPIAAPAPVAEPAAAPEEPGVITIVAPTVPPAEAESTASRRESTHSRRRHAEPEVPAVPATAPVSAAPLAAHAEPERRRLPVAAILGFVVLLAAGAIGGWMLLGRGDSPAPAASQMAAIPPAASTATRATATAPATTTTDVAPPVEELVPVAPAQPAIAEGAVDEEVQRRLEAERARLERLRQQEIERRQRQAEEDAARAAAAREPEPAPPQETATVAPAVTASAAPPSAPPVETATQPPPVRAGDYVAPGTPGLVDPQLVSLRKVSYPPMAKIRRAEGIVVLQALISEKGSVLDVKVLRGVPGNFGLNEAAVEAVRGGTFRPATKDGVAVRAHKTLTVPFKL